MYTQNVAKGPKTFTPVSLVDCVCCTWYYSSLCSCHQTQGCQLLHTSWEFHSGIGEGLGRHLCSSIFQTHTEVISSTVLVWYFGETQLPFFWLKWFRCWSGASIWNQFFFFFAFRQPKNWLPARTGYKLEPTVRRLECRTALVRAGEQDCREWKPTKNTLELHFWKPGRCRVWQNKLKILTYLTNRGKSGLKTSHVWMAV